MAPTQIDRALTPARVEEWVENHLRPFVERERDRATARGDKIEDWLSAEMQVELRAHGAKPVNLDDKLVRHIVDQGVVQHLLKSIVKETLEGFDPSFL